MAKKRIVKDYEQLNEEVITQLKLNYPNGFSENLIKFVNSKGRTVSALPFETEEVYYLIRMTEDEAVQIIEADEDYDEFGNLESDFGIEEVTPSPEDEEDFKNEDEEYDAYSQDQAEDEED